MNGVDVIELKGSVLEDNERTPGRSAPRTSFYPAAYRRMFTAGDVILINKTDAAEYFDFEQAEERIHALNLPALISKISAGTGEGLCTVAERVRREIHKIKPGIPASAGNKISIYQRQCRRQREEDMYHDCLQPEFIQKKGAA